MNRIVWTAAVVSVAALTASAAGPAKADADGKVAIVAVKGMSCPVWARCLQKVLSALPLPGAQDANVDLAKEQAVLDFAKNSKTTDEQVATTVRDAGFVPGKIEWRNPAEKHQNR